MKQTEFTEIQFLRMILKKEAEAREQAEEKLEKVEQKLEKFKNSYLVIEKKYYPKDLMFYKKSKMFRLHREDVTDAVWKDWCDDLMVDELDDSIYSISVCAMGIIEEDES